MTGARRGATPALAVLAVAVIVSAGCGGAGGSRAPGASPDPDGIVRTAGCATATSPPAMSIDGTPQPANQNALDAVADRLQPYAQSHFADVYSGLELRSEQDRIRVYRKPSTGFDDWVVREFTADCVEVVDARFSTRQLQAMMDRLSADLPYWQARGVQINEFAAEVDGSGIEVGTTDVERTRSELAQRYGTEIPFNVVYAAPAVADARRAGPYGT